MKMTYSSLSRSRTRASNLILNTTLAYGYKYNGRIWFFPGKYKLKINKVVIFFFLQLLDVILNLL